MSKFNAGGNREIIMEVEIDDVTWAVMGREPHRPEDRQYCTWIGNRCGLERGHYSMSREEAERDLEERIRLGY